MALRALRPYGQSMLHVPVSRLGWQTPSPWLEDDIIILKAHDGTVSVKG